APAPPRAPPARRAPRRRRRPPRPPAPPSARRRPGSRGGSGRRRPPSGTRRRRGRPSVVVARALAPADAGVDEAVEVAVEHLVGLRHLVARAKVLHELLAVEEVRADLVAPACRDVARELLLLRRLLFLLQQQQ